MQKLGRYVRECTLPADKVVATPFVPEFYFQAKRGFATTYVPRGFTDGSGDRAQQDAVGRLRAGPVPIILMEAERHANLGLDAPLVHAYLEASYRVAGEADFGGGRPYRVLVDARRAPSGTYEPLSLPCYA